MNKEFYFNKKMFYRQLLVVFIVFLFALVVILTGSFENEFGVLFIISIGFLYGLYQLYQFYRYIHAHFPVLKISEDGLYFQTRVKNQRFTPWEEIEQAGLISEEAYDTLIITGTKIVERSRKLKEFFTKLDPMVGEHVIVSISGMYLETSLLEVLDALPCKKSLLFDTVKKRKVLLAHPLDELELIKKYHRIEKKTIKGKSYASVKEEDITLHFVHILDQTMKESGIASLLRSAKQYTLWASIQALQKISAAEHLVLAQKIEVLRNKELSEEDFLTECNRLEEQWQSCSENLLTLSLDYYNHAMNIE
ncbi:MAG: hypothetical protein AB7U79_08335 [Candidatus Izemoplasmatales bacterium]